MQRITINTTLKIHPKDLVTLENELKNSFELVDYKVIPNTEELYNNDKTFKTLVNKVRQAQRNRDIYLNNVKK